MYICINTARLVENKKSFVQLCRFSILEFVVHFDIT